MALRFRRKIKVFPGISINLSKSGISASVGPEGVTTNMKPGPRSKTTVSALGVYETHTHQPRPLGDSVITVLVIAAVAVFAVILKFFV